MKILVVCQLYYPENFIIYKIAEGLVKKGHDVSVLTGKPNYGYNRIVPGYENISFENINGVKVHRVKLYPRNKTRFSIIRNYLSFWRNSKRWVRKTSEQFDVVYSMSLSPVTILSAGNLYKRKHKVPHVVHCVDLWPESVLITHAVKKDSLLYKILYKWSKLLYEGADRILVGSPSFVDYFRDVLKIRTDHISFVPQCALVEEINSEKHDYQNNAFNILYCGNIGLIQLIPLICQSMTLLKDKNVVFHVIGMGPLSSQLESDIKKYGLEDKVIYHGPIVAQKAAAYFASADALYVSLKNEGTVGKTIPNKLMMYLNFGKPIIGVVGGDGRDILLRTQGDYVCDENPESIVKTIKCLMSLGKEEKEKIGKANHQYYIDHFSSEVITSQVEEKLYF